MSILIAMLVDKNKWSFKLDEKSAGKTFRLGEYLNKAILVYSGESQENKNGAVLLAQKPRMEVIVCLAAGGLALPNH